MSPYSKCTLCAHACGVDRTRARLGRCRSTDKPKIARAALHMWEEPVITGRRGSGTVFFCGCSLGCIFCQNREISHGTAGREVDEQELVQVMLALESEGAENINFVTPTHYAPTICSVIVKAKEEGLKIPIVYNTSGFDSPEALRMLDGLVDVYLPDFKYTDARLAARYSHAPSYPEHARAAIAEMMRQCPTPVFDHAPVSSPSSADSEPVERMRRGVIARILVLPGALANAKLAISHLYRTYGDNIYISILAQYTPLWKDLPSPLDRRLTHAEYGEVVDYALRLGVKNAFIQRMDAASESFVPSFANFDVPLDSGSRM